MPLVKDLEEDFVNVGMRLLNLIEQHDTVGSAPHRFGEDAALAIAHIAGRGALEGRDGVGFLEFAHIDGDDVLFTAVQRLGERECGFRLADPGVTGEEKDPDGFAGIVQSCP